LTTVESDLEKVNEEESVNQKEIVELSRKEAIYKKEVEEIEKAKKSKELLQKALEQNDERVEVLSKLEEIFGRNGIQITILRHYLTYLDSEVNRFLSKLTNGKMSIQFKTLAIQASNEKPTLEIYVYENGRERRYELLSGGEQFRVNFAIRLGIAMFISKIKVCFS